MNTASPVLSVIAPMYNEADNIDATLRQLTAELDPLGISYELVFVDDGSTDATRQVCAARQADYPQLRVAGYTPNCGRGRALREGFAQARGSYVVTIDFDLSYDASHITRMYQTLASEPATDLVLVSCYMPGGATIGVDPLRLLVSRLGNSILAHSFDPPVCTSTCVVRGYRAAVLRALPLESDGKDIHLEILSKALTLGYRVREIPGTLRKRKAGTSKFNFSTTSKSHIIFTLIERPARYFRLLGLLFFLLSGASGLIMLLVRFAYLDKTIFFLQAFSPNLTIFLFMIAVFSWFFSLAGIFFIILRKELLRVQSLLLQQSGRPPLS